MKWTISSAKYFIFDSQIAKNYLEFTSSESLLNLRHNEGLTYKFYSKLIVLMLCSPSNEEMSIDSILLKNSVKSYIL